MTTPDEELFIQSTGPLMTDVVEQVAQFSIRWETSILRAEDTVICSTCQKVIAGGTVYWAERDVSLGRAVHYGCLWPEE